MRFGYTQGDALGFYKKGFQPFSTSYRPSLNFFYYRKQKKSANFRIGSKEPIRKFLPAKYISSCLDIFIRLKAWFIKAQGIALGMLKKHLQAEGLPYNVR